MGEVVRFEAADGVSVLVEADEDSIGVERVRRGEDGVILAGKGWRRRWGRSGRRSSRRCGRWEGWVLRSWCWNSG